jgi:hypothetical protein
LRLAGVDEDAAPALIRRHDEGRHRVDDLCQDFAVVALDLIARALAFEKLVGQHVGAALQQFLLLAQLQQVARAADELGMIDGAEQEVGCPCFQRGHAERPLV